MATVHPSRLGLVPQDARDKGRFRNRSRSRSRTPDRTNKGRRSRSRERRRSPEERRRSPEYDEYRQRSESLPWRVEENMYPPRDKRSSNGGGDYLTSRQQQRESRTVNIWPPSPKAHVRELSPAHGTKRSHKRERSPSASYSESSSSEEERMRRKKKERKRAKEKMEKEERREKKKHGSRHRKSEDPYDGKDSRRSRGGSQDRKRNSRSVNRTRSPSVSDDEDQWVEKKAPSNGFIPVAAATNIEVPHVPVTIDDTDPDMEIGPQPMKVSSAFKVDERSYGGALLRGEGSAMAAFLAEDVNARIPRRGEIGLTSDEIATFESAGYVMSGSRHRRMNAVRMRKENQVISAEEKRGILKLQKEERERREEILREEFKELVDERLKAGGK